ncbi:CcmD family protein [Rubrivirga sp. IMCC43871]|uniref:CcmD family protein n=1 Tax=Rubrivirga sp. IMCC43871 TaxID=3391575 RepID=UPI0039900757
MLLQADTTIAVLDADAVQATTAQPQGIERVMLVDDKLPVVLAVVLIVWIGVLALLVRTDRRLARIERDLDARDATR